MSLRAPPRGDQGSPKGSKHNTQANKYYLLCLIQSTCLNKSSAGDVGLHGWHRLLLFCALILQKGMQRN